MQNRKHDHLLLSVYELIEHKTPKPAIKQFYW